VATANPGSDVAHIKPTFRLPLGIYLWALPAEGYNQRTDGENQVSPKLEMTDTRTSEPRPERLQITAEQRLGK
jgi:hypothetical protein